MFLTSLRQIYLTCGLMFVLLFSLVNQSLTIDLSLEEVVEAVNFSRLVIEDGELQARYFEAPKPERSSEDKIKLTEANAAQLKEQYKMTKHHKEKSRIKKELAVLKGRAEHFTKGRGYYEQRNIVFKVKEYSAYPNPSEDLYLRIHRIDRHDEYEGDLGVNNSYIELLNLSFQYHHTIISDGEQTFYLWADCSGGNAGAVDEDQSSTAMMIPCHLWGRSFHEIVLEKVSDFKKSKHKTSVVYTIEFELEHDLNGLASVTGLSAIDKVTQKVWVNSQQGFAVVRIEVRFYVQGNVTIVQVCRYGQFREFRGGIWYPGTFENTTYNPLDPTEITGTYSYEIEQADFNVGIPNDYFNNVVDNASRLGLFNYTQNTSTDTEENQ